MPLQLGQTQTVSIAANGLQNFTVSGANFVQINSLSGDADLYVYSNAARTGDSLVCDSRNSSDNTTFDTCELNGASFVSVAGVRAGQFTITTSTEDPSLIVVDTQSGPTDPPVDPTEAPEVPTEVATGSTDVADATTSGSGGGSAGGGGGLFGPSLTTMLLLPVLVRRRSTLANKNRASNRVSK